MTSPRYSAFSAVSYRFSGKGALSAAAVAVLVTAGAVLLAPRVDAQTSFDGYILDDQWLALGPFQSDFGCSGNAGNLLTNHIAPSFIHCQYPEDGDEVEYDAEIASTGGYNDLAPASPDGLPMWRPFAENSFDCDLDFEGDVAGPLDDQVMFLATYVENVSADDIEIVICANSDDDLQVWWDDQVVINAAACRPRGSCLTGACDNTGTVIAAPGTHRIIFGVWENGGGWGGSLRLMRADSLEPIVEDGLVDDPDFDILGTESNGFTKPCVPLAERAISKPDCDPEATAPVSVTIQGELAGLPADDMVTVTEDVLGPFDAAAVAASNGGTVEDIVPTGIVGNGFINAWLFLGPFNRGGGAAPGETAIRQDYLTDGQGIDEATVNPRAGDTVDTDFFGAAASTGLALSTRRINPGGVPAWFPETSTDDTFDFNNDEFYGTDINDVMVYAVAYIIVPQDIDANLCVGSDDSIQVLLDDEEIHINNVARPFGGAGQCQDTAFVTLTEGTHRVMAKIFEGGGGHGFRLGFQDPNTGGPIEGLEVCLDPDQDPCRLDPIGARIVWNVTRQTLADGIGYTVDLPRGRITASGSVDGLPIGGDSFRSVCEPKTSFNGEFNASAFLYLGPFTHSFGCGGLDRDLLGNHIAPARIDCEYPVLGDEIEYDPAEAASDAYIGPESADGQPFWRDFNGTTIADLNSDTGGDNRMSWLATYVEYKGAAPLQGTICFNSDDGGQVVVNDTFVHVNNICRGVGGACGQDQIPFLFQPDTVYCFRIAAWNAGGGWGARLAILDDLGVPVLDGDPDWVFHGQERPADFQVPECRSCDPEPVTDLTCEFGQVGLGQGLILKWTNPPNTDPLVPTVIAINGEQVGTVASDATQTVIPSNRLPGGLFTVTVTHCGGVPAACSPFNTDDAGNILGSAWLVVGPFANSFGCNNSNEDILGNHLAPSFIGCLYPEEGDEIEYDANDPENVSFGHTPVDGDRNVGPSGLPLVEAFDDGSPDGDQDLDGHYGDQSDQMAWMLTYIEYTGDVPKNIEICFGSDDGGQIWFNDKLVHNNNACRGRGDCQDRVPVTITEAGPIRVAVGVWERGGGWGQRFALFDGETGAPIVDGDPDWVFHGRTRPVPEDQFPCVEPADPVEIDACDRSPDGSVEVTWTNPFDNNPMRVTVDGVEVASLPADAESVTIPADDLPSAGLARICIENGAFQPACCGVVLGNELYINCGGPRFEDALGRVWSEDTAGNPSPFLTSDNVHVADFGMPENVDLTVDDTVVENEYPAEIFPQERWNDGPVEYTIVGLDPGDYDVTLLFMERCCSDGCDPAQRDDPFAGGACRIFNILIDDEIVEENFSQVLLASELSGNLPGVDSYSIAVSVSRTVTSDGTIKITIEDLGGGNPPENASIKGIAIVPSGGVQRERDCTDGADNDGDGDVDCNDSDCANRDVCKIEGGLRVPGDCNGDATLNISDPVCLLGFLFQGNPTELPCGDGTQGAPGNVLLMDANGDGNVNLSDAVWLLNFLFGGGPAHVLAEAGNEQRGCVPIAGCDSSAACQ